MASVGEANQKRVVAVRQEVTGPAARVPSSGSRPPSAGTALQTAQEEVAAAEKAYEATASRGKKAMTAEQRALRKAAAGCGTQSSKSCTHCRGELSEKERHASSQRHGPQGL